MIAVATRQVAPRRRQARRHLMRAPCRSRSVRCRVELRLAFWRPHFDSITCNENGEMEDGGARVRVKKSTAGIFAYVEQTSLCQS